MEQVLAHLPPAAALLGVAAAALAGGLSRGFSGFGAALVFVPLASAAVGPRAAIPVLALLECVSCLVFLPNAWRLAARREVAVMSGGAICAVPIGAMILAATDPVALRWGLTALVLLAVAVLASGWRYRGPDSAPLLFGVGALGGAMSGTAMLGGVPPAAWWLGRAAPAATVRANMNLYFAVLTVAVTAAFAWRGLFGWQTAWLALAAGPAYAAGLWGGTALFGLASERVFRGAGYALILVAAVLGMPLWDPFTGR
ncbi:sulfite exporter TauE/SafE family protein [Roseomonas sp. PWR1]|uniref:Probable membrane transporter protein n=1 Tax=Roseomonas nitratireducens TaxID=2820810 RepID=A0ABS4AS00_9PROT|nr:sulfite exporter TauE/SafE family protein [Neoroseomonas nitratireducens]MBP0463616.1 sulfite exporter TauE/SafE family protein [Neoroseomonas nitratireducens]